MTAERNEAREQPDVARGVIAAIMAGFFVFVVAVAIGLFFFYQSLAHDATFVKPNVFPLLVSRPVPTACATRRSRGSRPTSPFPMDRPDARPVPGSDRARDEARGGARPEGLRPVSLSPREDRREKPDGRRMKLRLMGLVLTLALATATHRRAGGRPRSRPIS